MGFYLITMKWQKSFHLPFFFLEGKGIPPKMARLVMRVVHAVMCTNHLEGAYSSKIITVIFHYLLSNALTMLEIQLDVTVENGIAICVANDVIPVNSERFNQSKSLLHIAIECH